MILLSSRCIEQTCCAYCKMLLAAINRINPNDIWRESSKLLLGTKQYGNRISDLSPLSILLNGFFQKTGL